MRLIGATENTWYEEVSDICAWLWKNNLACRIMLNAKELGIILKFRSSDLTTESKEFRLAIILKKNFTLAVAKILRKLNLISLKQLLTGAGDQLITWQQLKLFRNNLSKEKKRSGFKQ